MPRCAWCGDQPLYVDYHDQEWGVPVVDALTLFERLSLEGMQAGLSWYTVLKKRAHMRERFFGFDPRRLVERGPGALASWLDDPGLIRHRGKLEALVGNAGAWLALDEDPVEYLWSFVGGAPVQSGWHRADQIPAHSEASVAMSKALRRRGFRFVGPTICYAFMQSAGMVNDHLLSCERYQACGTAGAAWRG